MKWVMFFLAILMVKPILAEEVRSVTVTGNSTVEVVPDRAMLNVGVNVTKLDPAEAMNELAQKSTEIVAAVKAAGIDPKHIQTSQLTLQPFWDGEKNNGFIASNNVNIEVSAIDEMPKLLGALSKAGMNDLSGLTFFSSLESEKEKEAMLLAVADAKARAQALATASGMKLGDPITIDYSSGNSMPQPMMMAKAMAADAVAMPVEAGSVGITSQVNIRFELVK